MRKRFVFLCLVLNVAAFALPYYFEKKLEVRTYDYECEIGANAHSVFFFSESSLLKEIKPHSKSRVSIKKTSRNPRLISESPISKFSIVETSEIKKFDTEQYRNGATIRTNGNAYLLGTILSILLITVGGVKLFSPDTFYTYIMPFGTYSTTAESMGQMTLRNVLLPTILFIFCFGVSAHFYTRSYNTGFILINIGLILLLTVFKWIFSRTICQLFDFGSFYKLHFLEFLKFGIIFSILFLLTQTIIQFNFLESNFIYWISLFLYLSLWFVRLILIFYRQTNRNFIYFFSYLCGTEGIPILILLVFWR